MMSDLVNLILVIDPGSAKVGIGVVNRSGETLYRDVIPAGELVATVVSINTRFKPDAIICGNGTRSADACSSLRAIDGLPPLSLIDEAHSTEEARTLWLSENPARGLKRLIPRSLRVPDGPVDAYVPQVLAARYFGGASKTEGE